MATVVDPTNDINYGDVNLDSDPCVFPDCGHVSTMSSVDRLVIMDEHYTVESDGTISGIISSDQP